MNLANQAKLAQFAKENGIKLVVLFGSRAKSAKGEKTVIREDSDFDIAFLKKAGFPQMLGAGFLHIRQAAGQGFGVGEEGLDRGVS